MSEPFWYDLGQSRPLGAPEPADSSGRSMGPEDLVGRIVQLPPLGKRSLQVDLLAARKERIQTGIILEAGHPELGFPTKSIQGFAPGDARVPAVWIQMLHWLSAYYFTPLPQVFATCLPKPALDFLFAPAKPGKAAKDSHVVTASKETETKQPARRKPTAKQLAARALADAAAAESLASDAATQADRIAASAHIQGLQVTPEQRAAIDAVQEAYAPFRFQTYLLHGVTGSGKTLVYLHLARRALELGRRVLVLLPEIALTPQTLSRFRSFLERPVLALHSNLSAPDRRELWRAIYAREADVIVGARSAALCPIDNLGLIVVDEEHDGSYKQSDASPRYNARDLALWRGRSEGCPVVLGSATPAVETYHSAQAGKFRLLEMHARATGSSQPKIRIVDMREQHALQGGLLLSIPLREALQKALESDEQAILFLNRRGYAHRRVCKSCGAHRECPHCVAPLVYHKSKQALICHYCGFNVPVSAPCLKCQGTEWLDVGRGIEKVEEYLEGLYPGAGIARLDRDSTSTIGGAEKILSRFKSGELRLLLGTQMVAKGHDFPKVNLVGVIDADSGLGLSDFRAQERAFQLITQVSGRAGRHRGEGEVYLQTFRPDNPLLGFALTHDYGSFYRDEIARREELDYPPFRRLLLIEITGDDEAIVDAHMRAFADAFTHFATQADVIVRGPAFAALKKIKDQYRAQILGKGKAPNQLQWVFHQALERYKPKDPQKTKLRADMDPLSMM
jgi:primosomal protein N' (replication factor Y) (superfamily II helicase)